MNQESHQKALAFWDYLPPALIILTLLGLSGCTDHQFSSIPQETPITSPSPDYSATLENIVTAKAAIDEESATVEAELSTLEAAATATADYQQTRQAKANEVVETAQTEVDQTQATIAAVQTEINSLLTPTPQLPNQ